MTDDGETDPTGEQDALLETLRLPEAAVGRLNKLILNQIQHGSLVFPVVRLVAIVKPDGSGIAWTVVDNLSDFKKAYRQVITHTVKEVSVNSFSLALFEEQRDLHAQIMAYLIHMRKARLSYTLTRSKMRLIPFAKTPERSRRNSSSPSGPRSLYVSEESSESSSSSAVLTTVGADAYIKATEYLILLDLAVTQLENVNAVADILEEIQNMQHTLEPVAEAARTTPRSYHAETRVYTNSSGQRITETVEASGERRRAGGEDHAQDHRFGSKGRSKSAGNIKKNFISVQLGRNGIKK